MYQHASSSVSLKTTSSFIVMSSRLTKTQNRHHEKIRELEDDSAKVATQIRGGCGDRIKEGITAAHQVPAF